MSVIDYLSIKILCEEGFKEILIAELSEMDYDSMMETGDGMEAYIKPKLFDEELLQKLLKKYKKANATYEVEEVIERNWNEDWEKNYDPIVVGDQILVRATFHEADINVSHEIVINPRMSFGTGHHATTYLMLKNQLTIDHKGKRVLDAGCGTAILAIMAEKLGADEVIAYDNNSWSTDNAPENVALNDGQKITILEGTIASLGLSGTFDLILANINKNVLLEEMKSYISYLKPSGQIIFSGFYETDEGDMTEAAQREGMKLTSTIHRNNWSSMIFRKS